MRTELLLLDIEPPIKRVKRLQHFYDELLIFLPRMHLLKFEGMSILA